MYLPEVQVRQGSTLGREVVSGGRAREVKAGLWVLAALSLLFFGFYPY